MNPWNGASPESIARELDDIAMLVAANILAKQSAARDSTCPPPSRELMGRVHALGLDACAVLDEMNVVLYGQLGFRSSSQEEYYDDNNSYIDMVRGSIWLHVPTLKWCVCQHGNNSGYIPFFFAVAIRVSVLIHFW